MELKGKSLCELSAQRGKSCRSWPFPRERNQSNLFESLDFYCQHGLRITR
jgi:hypothetical protein